MIIASRVGCNGTNPTDGGRLGDCPRDIGRHVKSNISCLGRGIEAGRSRRQHTGTGFALRKGNGHRFGCSCTGGGKGKDCFPACGPGILGVCDGNFLIIASRFGRNGGNPTGGGRLGDCPRHIGAHVEGDTPGNIELTVILVLSAESCLAAAVLGEGNGHTFGCSCTGGSERKDSISGCESGIFFVCDGNNLIIVSRFGRNGGNKSIRDSFGNSPRHIRRDIDNSPSGNGGDGYIGVIYREFSCRRFLGEGNVLRFPPSIGGSERKDGFPFCERGILFVCDGNFLIIVSRFGRNGANPTGGGRLGDCPRHIGGCHVESNISGRGGGSEVSGRWRELCVDRSSRYP